MTHSDPIERFRTIYTEVQRLGIAEPSAMNLATADGDGRPSSRMVLLKGYDHEGFVFYTNLGSRKARELVANPYAALCMFWQPIECQIRIEGTVEQVSDAEADAYFQERPEMSRIGAWASKQSQPLPDRAVLVQRIEEARERFGDGGIPRPPFWSGFRVRPYRIEFWHGREFRLHERHRYERTDDGEWSVTTLYP